MKFLKKFNIKAIKVFIALFMVFSMVATNISSSNAWDDTIPHTFTRVKEIKYPEWWGGKIPSLASWSTYSTQYNGKWSYCLESSKNSPQSGNYTAEVIANNTNVRKMLYYGFGGPGATSIFADDYDLKSGVCPNDDYLTNDDVKYLFTHIFLSGAYSNDWNGFDEQKFNDAFGGTYGTNLMNFYRNICALPDPADMGRADFSGNILGTLTATYDTTNKQQITNSLTFNALSTATVQIPLQDNVTIHIGDTTQTGGTATVSGGQSFYLTAPLKNSPSDVQTQEVTASGIEKFTALAIRTGTSNTQTEGSWDWDPNDAELYINIDWLDVGNLRLSKVNNTSEFQNGSSFRLVSTSYNGFDETYEVTKDADGDYELLIEGLPVGTYALTETDCDEYFAPTVAQWSVEITKDTTTKKIVVNTLRPTGNLNVVKSLEDATEGATNVADDDVTKTSYSLKATDDIIDTVSLKKLYSKGDIITVGSGKCVIDIDDGNTMTYSKGVELVKGTANEDGTYAVDEDGNLQFTGLPLGKYEVIETSCVDGYALDETPYDFSITQQDYTTTVYVNEHKQTNEITKTAISKTDVGGTELVGATMQVTDKDGNVIDEWTSTNEPHEIDGLVVGETYIIHEDLAPVGYATASDIEFTVENNGNVQKHVMIDEITKVVLHKQDITTSKELAGAELQVTDKDGNIVDKWTSTTTAHEIQGLKVGETYTLTETIAPKGYKIAQSINFTVSDTGEQQHVVMKDELLSKKVKTGDDTNIEAIELCGLLSMLGFVLLGVKRKEEKA